MYEYTKSYDQFVDETWRYISPTAVSDQFWEDNQDFIHELTLQFYEHYKRNIEMCMELEVTPRITTKDCGKFIEITLSAMNKHRTHISQ